MFVTILISSFLVVCPVLGITLPNGFTFDEKQFFKLESRLNLAAETCDNPYQGCASDCATQLYCDNHKVIDAAGSNYLCDPSMPYCVKNPGGYPSCSGNFPLSNQVCLTKAINSFVCTEDGKFPDPTDCGKYHVCNGTSHTIEECPSSSKFESDASTYDPYTNPGTGEFSCRYGPDYEACMCDKFYCGGMSGQITFRPSDYFHYAYCFEVGTVRRIFMFKCPKGTQHDGIVSITNTVDCRPIGPRF